MMTVQMSSNASHASRAGRASHAPRDSQGSSALTAFHLARRALDRSSSSGQSIPNPPPFHIQHFSILAFSHSRILFLLTGGVGLGCE